MRGYWVISLSRPPGVERGQWSTHYTSKIPLKQNYYATQSRDQYTISRDHCMMGRGREKAGSHRNQNFEEDKFSIITETREEWGQLDWGGREMSPWGRTRGWGWGGWMCMTDEGNTIRGDGDTEPERLTKMILGEVEWRRRTGFLQ